MLHLQSLPALSGAAHHTVSSLPPGQLSIALVLCCSVLAVLSVIIYRTNAIHCIISLGLCSGAIGMVLARSGPSERGLGGAFFFGGVGLFLGAFTFVIAERRWLKGGKSGIGSPDFVTYTFSWVFVALGAAVGKLSAGAGVPKIEIDVPFFFLGLSVAGVVPIFLMCGFLRRMHQVKRL